LADRLSAAQVQEWEYFEQRYGPLLVHERIDIGFGSLMQMTSRSGKPLSEFMPTWWSWVFEKTDEYDEYDNQPDEAGKMIATMRAMARKWATKQEEVGDAGDRSGSTDNGGRDATEVGIRSGVGSDQRVRGGDGILLRSDARGERHIRRLRQSGQ
jgi:hypothetical protein